MEQSYLTLGDMLTFVGLIIAAFQLIKPRYLLTWKLSNNFLKSLTIILLVLGYFSPLASTLLPKHDSVWYSFSLEQVLQMAGFSLITIGLLFVIYIYSPFNRSHLITTLPKLKLHFNKQPKKNWRVINAQLERSNYVTTRSARKFYTITSKFLVRGNIEEVVEVVHFNLKALLGSAQQYTPKHMRFTDEDTEPQPNGSNYCFEVLLQILTDDDTMRHISTNNRSFLHALVWQETHYTGWHNNELSNIIYTNIVKHLAINKGSFLYTQKDTNNGSARFGNVYELLTGNTVLQQNRVIPSQLTWNVSHTDVAIDDYADALFKLVERMIDNYKKQPNSQLLQNIIDTLNQLIGDMSGVTRVIAYNKDIPQAVKKSLLIKLHSAITIGILHKTDDPDSFKTSKAELEATNEEHTFDYKNLTGLLAHKIYDLIEDLIILFYETDDPDEELRHTIHSFISPYVHTPVSNRYQELLWERLFDKAVDGKLEITSNLEGYYPNVLRFMIYYLVPRNSFLNQAQADARNRLMGIMDNQLKDALLTDKKMTNDEPMKNALIPSNVKVVINKTKKTVKYYHVNNKGKQTLVDLKTKVTIRSKASPSPAKTSRIKK
jgi:hypothetical protein